MRFDIATLFPEMCETVVNSSIIGRGIKAGKLEVHCHQIRDYTTDKHRRTDLRLHGNLRRLALLLAQQMQFCRWPSWPVLDL